MSEGDRYDAALAVLSKMADEAEFAADYARRSGSRGTPVQLELDARAVALAKAFDAVSKLRENGSMTKPTEPTALLITLYREAEEAVLRLDDGKHTDTTIEYWKGRRDGIAYAIRELQQATGDFGGSDFLGVTGGLGHASFHHPDFRLDTHADGSVRLTLGDQLERDHERHRTLASDLREDR